MAPSFGTFCRDMFPAVFQSLGSHNLSSFLFKFISTSADTAFSRSLRYSGSCTWFPMRFDKITFLLCKVLIASSRYALAAGVKCCFFYFGCTDVEEGRTFSSMHLWRNYSFDRSVSFLANVNCLYLIGSSITLLDTLSIYRLTIVDKRLGRPLN